MYIVGVHMLDCGRILEWTKLIRLGSERVKVRV